MLNHAATIAVALRHLADQGWTPKGTLVFAATADQEHRSELGMQWLVEHHLDQVRCDFAITETGGFPSPGPAGLVLPVIPGEKGSHWLRLQVHGDPVRPMVPAQGSALARAAGVITRLDQFVPPCQVHDIWRASVHGSGWGGSIAELLDPARIDQALYALPPEIQRGVRSAVAPTMTATSVHAGGVGAETATTPAAVTIVVNVRSLPGQTDADAVDLVTKAIGDLDGEVDIDVLWSAPSTSSPLDTPLSQALERICQQWYPGSSLVPFLPPGTSDARFFRAIGAVAYGFALFSERPDVVDLVNVFHGDDEWCDTESLGLTTAMWVALAHDLLGG